MKKTKKNGAIIVLIVLLLALAVGYAAFSSTLTINGTATGTGSWDVKFTDAGLYKADGTTPADSKYGSATIGKTTVDGDTITATVNLAYPGDGVLLKAVVTNNGKTEAKLKNFTITNNSADLEVTKADDGPANDEVLAANGGTCTATFLVKWKTDSTATKLDATSFTITYNYSQNPDPVDFTGTPSHTDV